MGIKLKLVVGVLLAPVLLLLFLASVDAYCRIDRVRNFEYNARSGAVCRRARYSVNSSETKITIRFDVDNPGCDWRYEIRSDTNEYRVRDNRYTGSWRDASRILSNRWTRARVDFDGTYTGKFAIFNVEDGGDTGNLNPGNADGELYFNINWHNCTCNGVPGISPNFQQPYNFNFNVPLGSQNNVNIGFGDANGEGGSTCNTNYRVYLYEYDTGVLVGSGNMSKSSGRYYRNMINLKPNTYYYWRVQKYETSGTYSYYSTNYVFKTEGPNPTKLATLGAPAAASAFRNYAYDRFATEVSIFRQQNDREIFSYNDTPYLATALTINESNASIDNTSKIGAYLNNYNNLNPLNGLVPNLYDYYMQRALQRRDVNGQPIVTYQTAQVIFKYNNTDEGLQNENLHDSTPLNSASTEAVIHANQAFASSLDNQDAIIDNSNCAEDAIHFINGDLHIGGNFLSVVPPSTERNYCLFIIKGDLYIDEGSANQDPLPPNYYDVIEAFFIVNGETFVTPDPHGLYVRGGIVTKQIVELDANGDPISGSSGLSRDRSRSGVPSHIIDYDPGYVFKFRDILGAREYSLREL